jgi:hypothetical protein
LISTAPLSVTETGLFFIKNPLLISSLLADATRINLTSEAQKNALRAVLQELEGKGTLVEEYIQVLLAQELRENSKWIITSGGTLPVIDLGGSLPETQPAATP